MGFRVCVCVQVVDRRARNLADGTKEETKQTKQLEVFQTQTAGCSVQVIRSQTSTTSSWHNSTVSSYYIYISNIVQNIFHFYLYFIHNLTNIVLHMISPPFVTLLTIRLFPSTVPKSNVPPIFLFSSVPNTNRISYTVSPRSAHPPTTSETIPSKKLIIIEVVHFFFFYHFCV